jgi:hypothetical protein
MVVWIAVAVVFEEALGCASCIAPISARFQFLHSLLPTMEASGDSMAREWKDDDRKPTFSD